MFPQVDFFIITGMMRSGTTLLDKLLNSHSELTVYSQPFPLLFVDIKHKFYQKIKHPETYNVLGHLYNETYYNYDDFEDFLSSQLLLKADIKQSLIKMDTYSGTLTQYDDLNKIISKLGDNVFIAIYKQLLSQISENKTKLIGSKEVLCEEFLPHLCNNNFKCIIIIRDPRDVIVSMNLPKRKNHISAGEHIRPTLWNLRQWRKCIAYCAFLKNNPNFTFIKYEDLVSKPIKVLRDLTRFLGINSFHNNVTEEELKSQNGNTWLGNSSASDFYKISNSRSKIYNELPLDLIRYIETICYYEMKYCTYPFSQLNNYPDENSILNFKEPFEVTHNAFDSQYSREQGNIQFELERLQVTKASSSEKIEKFFLFKKAFFNFSNKSA